MERERERERDGAKAKMAFSIFQSSTFQPPQSVLIAAMTVISFVSIASLGLAEIKGLHLQYSKLWNSNSKKLTSIAVSSRIGMLILYSPAFLAAVSSFWVFPDHDLRSLLVKSALALHFFKRIMEVLFVHKYSGKMVIDDTIAISLSYFLSTATMVYAQHLTQGFPEPSHDTKYFGSLLFLVGIAGNFYHHYLLSTMRKTGDKDYKIPKGGLFSLVICPHYLFEILAFIGITLISQTLYACSFTLGTIVYLMGRSYATRKWYISKFEDFPKNVKAIIPYVF